MKNPKKRKNAWKICVCILGLVAVQTLPIFYKRPINSKIQYNDRIAMYYQAGDDSGAQEVFELLEEKAQDIYTQMNAVQKERIKVYIYTSQFSLSLREAGFVTLLFAPSWFIGDSENGDILMVSPNTAVKGHTHDSILNATLHELVHSIVYQINPKLSYFWDNGLATYLAHQSPSKDDLESFSIPNMEDMKTENGLKFGNMGGYAFSYNYIEFLDQQYGWDKVMAYASGAGTYEQIFRTSEAEIYREWSQALGG